MRVWTAAPVAAVAGAEHTDHIQTLDSVYLHGHLAVRLPRAVADDNLLHLHLPPAKAVQNSAAEENIAN